MIRKFPTKIGRKTSTCVVPIPRSSFTVLIWITSQNTSSISRFLTKFFIRFSLLKISIEFESVSNTFTHISILLPSSIETSSRTWYNTFFTSMNVCCLMFLLTFTTTSWLTNPTTRTKFSTLSRRTFRYKINPTFM